MFLEALIYNSDVPDNNWYDRSTSQDFIFESARGVVKLRKRTAYPQTIAYAQGSVLVVGYGNIQLGQQIAHHDLQSVEESLFHTDEFLYIEIDLSKTEVLIQRDTLSTLPIYAGYQEDRLALSSRHSRVIELLDSDKLQVDRVALLRYLCALDSTFGTLFKDVLALHDRMRFNWKKGQGQLQIAPHAGIQGIIKNRNGSIGRLREELESTLETYKQRYVLEGAGLACEWSGGIDSSLVAGYFADQSYGVTTATMILPDTEGVSQFVKLQDFTARVKTVDNITVQLDANRHYRFQEAYETSAWKPTDFREMTAVGLPLREYLEVLREKGFTCMFTGFGGDELCEENNDPHKRLRHEQLSYILRSPNWQPPVWWTPSLQAFFEDTAATANQQPQQTLSPVSTTIARQGFCENNIYIEQGIWVVNPLADPRLYAYCQSLPLRYRVYKNFLKMYLEARQMPHSIYRGTNESFKNFYYTSACKHTGAILEMFMSNSVMAKAGLIDKDFVLATHDKIVALPFSPANLRMLFDIIRILNVEISLQTSGVRSL